MKLVAWKYFAGMGVIAGTGHFLVPSGSARGLIYLLVACSGVVGVLVGIRQHQPDPATPWYLFAIGLAFFLTGDLFFYYYKLVRDVPRPFPSAADGFYLASYPLLIMGLLSLIRRRSPGGDRTSLIDASMIATSVGLLAEVSLIAPMLEGAGIPWLEKLISVAYPIADVALLAVALRLAIAAGSRRPAYYFLGLAVTCLLGADVAYAVVQLTGTFELGTPFDAGWMGFYLFSGVAALHPTMSSLTEPATTPEDRPHGHRLVVLGAVVLLPTAVLVFQAARGQYRDVPVVAAASVLLFLLVMARIAGLVTGSKMTAARERALRRAAAALVAATDRRSIYDAAIAAATDLVGDARAIVRMATWTDDELIAASSAGRPGGRSSPSGQSLAAAEPTVAEPTLDLEELSLFLQDPLGSGRRARDVLVAPILLKDDLHGAVVVASESVLPAGTAGALDILSSQVALALERAALTEDLHQRRGEARLGSLVQNSSDVISVVDADSTIRYQTPSVRQVLGHDPAALAATKLIDIFDPADRVRALAFFDEAASNEGTSSPVQLRACRPDGSSLEVEAIANNLLSDANVSGIVVTMRDISERKAFERELTEQAFHDSLTGLANRALFSDRLEHALSRRRFDDRPLAIMFLDLDDFKTVNDSLGHAAGDDLLVAVSKRLVSCVRPGDTTARLGGDEFAVLLEEMESSDVARSAASRILAALDEPFPVGGKEVAARTSLGIAFSGAEASGPDALLRNAEMAMYTAKRQGKGGYELFVPRMHEEALQRLELKADLQRALDEDQFVLHYQPIVDLISERFVGFEALIRWNHPQRGLTSPFGFIGIAEETGLIVPLGRWVLEHACRKARAWHAVHRTTMSVNISRRQIIDPGLVDDVAAILHRTGVPPEAVTLEVTESLVMQDVQSNVDVLHQLRSLGVRIAIDDFGTGHSSLATLRHLPIDVLKIDKAFVDGIATSREDAVLVATVIDLAHGLGLSTVAEGIEQREQLVRLRELNCSLGQGYHFAKPLPEGEIERLLREDPQRAEGPAPAAR